MKITFLTSGCIPIEHDTLENRPLGGIETAVIRLAEALSNLGQEVRVVTNHPNPKLSHPLYLSFRDFELLDNSDILIGVRDWSQLLTSHPARLRLFWTGDSYDQPQTIGIGDIRVKSKIDKFCFVSLWQATTMAKVAGLKDDELYILKNGIHSPYFERMSYRHQKRLIYSSTPYRGLKHLPAIFRKILLRHPDAELKVCSSFKVYEGAGEYPQEVLDEYNEVVKDLQSIENCEVLGSILQSNLAELLKSSRILAYPNTFEETSCISILEAKAAGCIPITSSLGALAETVGNAGICIEGIPGTALYEDSFIQAVDNILRDPKLAASLESKCYESIAENSWTNIALNFLANINVK